MYAHLTFALGAVPSFCRPSEQPHKRIPIIDTNAGNIGGCSLCGNKSANNLGYRRKLNRFKERYAEGPRYKVLRPPELGDIGMTEYALGNHAWRPVDVEADGNVGLLTTSRKVATL